MTDTNRDREPRIPRDTDELAPNSDAAKRADNRERIDDDQIDGDTEANPPRTTTKHFTAPKFGSAGSGGLEIEPGPERD